MSSKAAYTGPVVNKAPGRGDGLKVAVPKGSYILPADFVAALGQGNSLAGHMKIKEMYGRKSGQIFHGVPHNTINVSGGEDILSPLEVERSGGPEKLDESVLQVRGNWIQQLQGMHAPQKGETSFDDGGDDDGSEGDGGEDDGTDDGFDDTGESANDGIDAEGNQADANQDGVNDVTGDAIGYDPDNAFDANASVSQVDQVAQEAIDFLTQADSLYQQDPLNIQEVQSVPDYMTWQDPTQNTQSPDIQGGIISGPNGPESIMGWDPQTTPGNPTSPDVSQPGFNELTGWGTIYDPNFYDPTNNPAVGVSPQSPGVAPDTSVGPGVTSPGTGASPGVDTSNPGTSPVDTTGPVDVGGFVDTSSGGPRRSGFFKGGYIDYTVKTKGTKK